MNAIPRPLPPAGDELSRRGFMTFGGLALSASALALLAGRPALALAAEKKAGKAADPAADIRILNTALAAELEAIAAYEVGAKSGLLQPAVLELAVQFQGHHRQHADALAGTVRKLGGTATGHAQTRSMSPSKSKSTGFTRRPAIGARRMLVGGPSVKIPVPSLSQIS